MDRLISILLALLVLFIQSGHVPAAAQEGKDRCESCWIDAKTGQSVPTIAAGLSSTESAGAGATGKAENSETGQNFARVASPEETSVTTEPPREEPKPTPKPTPKPGKTVRLSVSVRTLEQFCMIEHPHLTSLTTGARGGGEKYARKKAQK